MKIAHENLSHPRNCECSEAMESIQLGVSFQFFHDRRLHLFQLKSKFFHNNFRHRRKSANKMDQMLVECLQNEINEFTIFDDLH